MRARIEKYSFYFKTRKIVLITSLADISSKNIYFNIVGERIVLVHILIPMYIAYIRKIFEGYTNRTRGRVYTPRIVNVYTELWIYTCIYTKNIHYT